MGLDNHTPKINIGHHFNWFDLIDDWFVVGLLLVL